MDQLKAEEEQMELMTMMMMQQVPHMEGFHPPQDTNTTMPLADLIDNNPLHTSIPCSSYLPSTISFSNNSPIMVQQQQTATYEDENSKRNSMEAMREMIFRMAAMQPIHIDPESVKAPKRRNVKISKDPQSVAARHRRERISERIRILQRLVPGGTKMDTASMLDEAIHYVKFLKTQLHSLQRASNASQTHFPLPMPMSMSSTPYFPLPHNTQMHQ